MFQESLFLVLARVALQDRYQRGIENHRRRTRYPGSASMKPKRDVRGDTLVALASDDGSISEILLFTEFLLILEFIVF
jgi:hypothetical protein